MTERLLPITRERGKTADILHILEQQEWSQKLLSDLKRHHQATFNHSLRVGVLSFDIATSLNLSRKDVSKLTLAGFLHDIGKLSIPCEALNAGVLNPEEKKEIFEGHADRGRITVERFNPQVAEIIGGHHMKQKEYILNSPANPQLAFKQRIVTIADQVDSLISSRAYKKSWTPSAAETYLGNVFENPEIISVAIQSRMRMAD